MKKIIVDIENGTETIQDLTEAELQEIQARNEEFEAQELAIKTNAERKAALWEKLGISEDEAKLLLG
jgi:hypothetical protein